MAESYLAEKIQAEKRENDYPESQIDFSVQNTPVICLIRRTQELESESKLYESKHNLNGTEPVATAFLDLLDKGREECQ